eukprot:TRINITY_DN6903_c0_g1_i6.p1 TRINITY_DN6903_c0_g1~~TRINITY_DN6903_c0_g1_i6.p1  ORF type:complete len:601 (-),score=113.21 TRINITY_DN6903_c0_g1_i6:168-1970(-)
MEATDAKDVNMDCKRKFSEAVNSDSNAVPEKPTKAVHFMQPKGKARYNNSLTEHRHRLADLLSKLLREHNWKEASGVLSMLMKGTSYRNFSMLTHKKYLAALEILSRSGDTHLNPIKIKHIHDIWTSKHAGGKAVTKKRYLIQLGFALYSLTQRDIEEALDAIKFLSQAPESRLDPFVNMLAGLIFYQLWYSGIPEETQLRNSDIHMASDANGTDSNDFPYVKPEQDDCSNNHSSVAMQDVKFPAQSDIVKSKANRPSEQCHHESSTSEFSMKPSAEMVEDEALSFNHDNNFIDASVSFPYDLDASLLPIRVGQTTLDMYSAYLERETSKEHHANAVKHLQQALHSTPPVSAALLPLIQLLLLVDQVDEALKELEDFCQSSNSVLPFRLKASLLECVSGRQPTVLLTSYEDILKKDPTCSHSLAELIRLYKNGNYNVESLLEMIALHLDATYGLAGTWGELASCFLGLQTILNSGYEEDCMSTVQHTNDTVGKPACSTSFNLIHPMFMKSEVRKSWRLRCRWWSSRHFSKDKYLSEVQAGDWELLTFKAACASHLYEPKFEYADKVLSGLKENEDGERYLFLQMHFQKSLKLRVNLNRAR